MASACHHNTRRVLSLGCKKRHILFFLQELLVDEYGIWHCDEDEEQEEEVSRDRKRKKTTAIEMPFDDFDDVEEVNDEDFQLPELATGYWTSESEARNCGEQP